ncbi:MAG: helicase-related protein [Candidatus Margulisiibacteriota bacterium]
MSTPSKDLKFFTNTESNSLHDRFVSTLKYAQFFDVLVGYFRTSGFNRLWKALESTEKIRILIGLSTDRKSVLLFEKASGQVAFDFESHKRCKEVYVETLTQEMDTSEDSPDVEIAARKFIEFIQSGKLELRVHPSRNLHAKVYITRHPEGFIDFGRVITGSSNFSESGLIAQREFNVELKDKTDVVFALDQFEILWQEGIDIHAEYIETIHTKTWLNDQITPYQVYLKFLYEYFKEDINLEEDIELNLPDGFMDLSYQKQAVISAKRILDLYNGVFLSDVVGLGKTFITALLLQKLPTGRKLIICPPVLADYWRETLNQFYVPGFEIESLGKLDRILEKGTDKYTYIVVDEAHRFRNEMTKSYEALHKICLGKKVILVSATPLNNKIEDILAQIKLFQPAKNSLIPGIRNLEAFFKGLQRDVNQFEKGTDEYFAELKKVSGKIRDQVLKHVMVRRTRSEIKQFFETDIKKQGLTFPKMADPQRIVYAFDSATESVFDKTIELLTQFSYARYTPLLFLKKPISSFDQISQKNIGGFMKGILVKRLESSFYAFRKTLRRFTLSYEQFIAMLDKGTVWISKDVDVYELLDADDEDALLKLVEEEKAQQYTSEDFYPEFREKLQMDLALLNQISTYWKNVQSDPKIEHFINELRSNPTLQNKKVIVFSESKETVHYLYETLEAEFPHQVLSYSSHGGMAAGESHQKETLREVIRANYQPGIANSKDDIRILITTDVLAEGINLHRSHIIINYDLPWNPTRVLQRVGRVNRVGTQHDTIYVFNFFPTAQSDAHLGLEDNIKGKLQAFHTILGEDSKYLSEEEEISTHELFGDRLFRKLNDKHTFEQEDEPDSELRYLQVIRNIRDKSPDVFESVKRLPKKARCARASEDHGLLTFFRKGRLKKFTVADDKVSRELSFIEAAKRFECKPDITSLPIPNHFYTLLKVNKSFLDEITQVDPIDLNIPKTGSSNEAFIIRTLKSSAIRAFKGFTEDDESYLSQVRNALENGIIAKNTCKKVKAALQQNLQPLAILHCLKQHLSESDLSSLQPKKDHSDKREIILSVYFVGDTTQ